MWEWLIQDGMRFFLSWTQSLDIGWNVQLNPPNSLSCLPKLHYSTGLPTLHQRALPVETQICTSTLHNNVQKVSTLNFDDKI